MPNSRGVGSTSRRSGARPAARSRGPCRTTSRRADSRSTRRRCLPPATTRTAFPRSRLRGSRASTWRATFTRWPTSRARAAGSRRCTRLLAAIRAAVRLQRGHAPQRVDQEVLLALRTRSGRRGGHGPLPGDRRPQFSAEGANGAAPGRSSQPCALELGDPASNRCMWSVRSIGGWVSSRGYELPQFFDTEARKSCWGRKPALPSYISASSRGRDSSHAPTGYSSQVMKLEAVGRPPRGRKPSSYAGPGEWS